MKYKVTSKHGILKKDLTFTEKGCVYITGDYTHSFKSPEVMEWLSAGWLIEIQPKEFTRDDMIAFALYYEENMDFKKALIGNEFIDEWIKSKHVLKHTS